MQRLACYKHGRGVRMKNKLYYVLFLFYAVMVAFILYINGVFTGDESSMVNLIINVGFLAIIGVLFLISAITPFDRGYEI